LREETVRAFVLSILTAFLFSCAAAPTQVHKHDAFTKHYEESLFQVTGKGMYSVEMVIKEHELKTGVNELDVIVHDKDDSDVVNAVVTVTPWMPGMGHGVFEEPSVEEKGGGLYSVKNILLIMSGHWELRVNINRDGMEDIAVFDFPDVKIDRGHEHKVTEAPADLDLSSDRPTDNEEFRISYKSSLAPIPINKIHTWVLKIKTSEGRPVTGADITLDGDMPEHGHGLPTQPEVTEYLGDGKYLVEGIKFSMPGWWTIKFNVKTGDKEDTVTFNLILKE
jgi:hypothetical protein